MLKGKFMLLKTNYEVGEIPLNEYPRPQFVREGYICLNGLWDFAVRKAGEKLDKYDCEILVPFSPETLNSKIPEGFVATANDRLYYSKTFIIDENWAKNDTVLHFGAVDYSCEVFVNGKKVGYHEGGYTAFSFYITDYILSGENIINVVVQDGTEESNAGRGKQSSKHGGIWYTPQSGIWQTVWLENIPKKAIREFNWTCNTERGEVYINVISDEIVNYTVYDGKIAILEGVVEKSAVLKYDFELWSPKNPKLYDIVLKTTCDCVKSYFGLRSFEILSDKHGKNRLGLNGKPYFFSGILDQGYWSDGMLTYPSDKAVYDELKMLKEMGFNTIRKHIKIEPMRWYYYCDKLGIIVWQDFVNGGGEYKFNHIALFPFLGFKHNDSDYKYFSRENKKGRNRFTVEWTETVNQLKNCVSIYMWTVFNEGWGQFDSYKIAHAVKQTDKTRIVESVSGWHDYNDSCDIKSLHTYYTPLKVPKDSRPVTLSEFGGYSLKVSEHVFDENKTMGYKKFKTKSALLKALRKLYLKKVLPLIDKGLCACIYTQVSDVEEEINGLITYDRKVLKISIDDMRELNDALYERAKAVHG